MQHRLVRAVIYLLALIVLTLINGTILTTDAWNISLPYFTLLWAVVLILFLWNLFAGFGDLGIGPGAGGLRLPGLGGVGRGAGAELEDAARGAGGLFGGGSNDALFSAPSGSSFIRKLTIGFAIAFFCTTLLLTVLGSRKNTRTVLQRVPIAGQQ